MAWEIVRKRLNAIRPYWRNPRRNLEAIKVVKESVTRYGYNVLITVDTQNVIVTGHARYMALRELGWTEADVLVLDIPLEKAKEFRIADNKTHEFASWDLELLKDEIEEIDPAILAPFFREGTIEALYEQAIPDPDSDVGIADEVPVEGHPDISRLVLCPHCLAEFTLEQLIGGMPDETADVGD